ncbi:DUF59 domain-containing protein [bacterium]|nr:DUF59 domain-containing protein [bacterium]
MSELQHKIEQALQTVYDPDFPLVDIYTLGLIYTITIQEKEKKIAIVMSFTTPVCPMADYLLESVKNAAQTVAEDYEITVETTFEPMWNPSMIRDEDLKRMFDQ